MHIALCAGEPSGDALGADLIQALKRIYPGATFSGVAGPRMQSQGCESLFPMETLSVMGVAEVIPKLPAILSLRKKLIAHFVKNPPDVFIGIDSPDFNLGVEKALKKRGIKTVHYVSPTVWAWREKRVLGIKKSTDLMLCVFPFEPSVYEKYEAKAKFIGHPAAERFANPSQRDRLRADLHLSPDDLLITLMPGSRSMEIKHLAPTFFAVAQALSLEYPRLRFILPMAKPGFRTVLEKLYQDLQLSFPLTLLEGQSREAMEAGDLVLCTSGTTTLEAMFLNKPMVVAYRMTAFNWWLAQLLVKVNYIAIPNLLANQKIVPEFVQHDATLDNLMQAMRDWLNKPDRAAECKALYAPYCRALAQDASQQAAEAIRELLT